MRAVIHRAFAALRQASKAEQIAMALIALGALFGVMTAFGHLADRLSAGSQPSSRTAQRWFPRPFSPMDFSPTSPLSIEALGRGHRSPVQFSCPRRSIPSTHSGSSRAIWPFSLRRSMDRAECCLPRCRAASLGLRTAGPCRPLQSHPGECGFLPGYADPA